MAMHTPGHKWNPQFDAGVKAGRAKMALQILDTIRGWQCHEEMRELIWLLRDIEKVAKDAIPN